MIRNATMLVLLIGFVAALSQECQAQNNSPYQSITRDRQSAPLVMEQGSLIRSMPARERPIGKHDIFTVRIEELSRFQSDGESERRKTSNYFATLLSWVRLNGLTKAEPTQQSGENPTIAGNLLQNRRAEGDIETTERLTINLAVEVVDIRPNGNLILEGQKEIRVNNEVWLAKISGVCRQEDIGVDRVILSQNIANLKIDRELKGFVRDSYRRGWFDRAFDRASPF